MDSRLPIVLSFAASDPTGGAGLQADCLTLASLGCHPASVVTALTAQDTRGVEALAAVDAAWVEHQARCVLADMPVAAFKIGVVGSAANAAAIAALLAERPQVPVVLDPVLASGRGDELAGGETVAALREMLFARTTVLTPNSLEARALASGGGGDAPPLDECARRLLEMGCRHVLITGTHEPGAQVVNALYGAGGVLRTDRWPRLPGSYHGSGCTLASAIAALLARGHGLEHAVREAQDYTWRTLEAAFRAGRGQALPDRFASRREPQASAHPGRRGGAR
jgi:hydroxymethylpyrimidine/phosphomethylpyrimidine kinase